MKILCLRLIVLVLVVFMTGGCAGRKARQAAAENAADQAAEEVVEPLLEDQPSAEPPALPAEDQPVQAPGSNGDYVLNELNFEIKKLSAEVKHLASELRDLQGKSSIWSNPMTIYNKEIILDTGSSFWGKIIYQDEKIIKIETLIGHLNIDRSTVVRIVENIPETPADELALESIGDRPAMSPTPANRAGGAAAPASPLMQPARQAPKSAYAPNVVLMGNINETKDRSGNLILSGKVKNIGGRRADFVKANFIFRQDWSGNTKTLTAFVKGTFHTFESGITSDASLLPGATGSFELPVPKSFGPIIGHSYTIDWEDY